MRKGLREIGLTEEEINTYLILLQTSDAKATNVAKKLGAARSSVYNWINTLIMKGLATETMINGVKSYNGVKPALIPSILEDRLDAIKRIVPELEKFTVIPDRTGTSVSLFNGNNGVKMVMNDILLTKKPYPCFGEIEKYFKGLDVFTQNWMRKAESLKLKGRLIGSRKQKFLIGKNEECRFLAEDLVPEISSVTYGLKTALFIWTSIPSIILIEDDAVTKRERALFETYWKQAKA